jgi:hypothetical protein
MFLASSLRLTLEIARIVHRMSSMSSDEKARPRQFENFPLDFRVTKFQFMELPIRDLAVYAGVYDNCPGLL